MIDRVEKLLRRLRHSFSRTAWAVRHLGLEKVPGAGRRPGLVLIQIDGLSRHEMQRALSAGRLPFLRKLLQDESYCEHSVYSGVTSNTPSVQAELFYGVRHAIPAFNYFDSRAQRIFSMFEGADVCEVEARLADQGRALLTGGSAFANIYGGGAAELHFCMRQLGAPGELFTWPRPTRVLLALWHFPSILRVLVLIVVELMLALVDAGRGLIAKEDLRRELRFIPARVGVSILMREWIVIRSAMDLMRGLPIIHMNFLGYDEQAHRRGPDSAFAHWTLKGIDGAIERVYRAACRSTKCDYDVWMYSDHGQDRVSSYQSLTGESLQDAVQRVFDSTFNRDRDPRPRFPGARDDGLSVPRRRPETQPPKRFPLATALGPFGCIYTFASLNEEEKDRYARALIADASIPLLVAAADNGRAHAWTPEGRVSLPEDAADLLGDHHPWLHQVAGDLVALSHHPDAGDYLVCGYRKQGRSLSFAVEHGAHGGVSPRETSAFALLPEDAPVPEPDRAWLRMTDLRKAAFNLLESYSATHRTPPAAPSTPPATLSILTYNIHNCLGMDGMLSPHRIARVVQREKPDVICLQEVDRSRPRSELADQAEVLAGYLAMHHQFYPSLQIEEGQYGNAILSRFPMVVMKAQALPYRRGLAVDETRGALWVRLDIGDGRHVQVITTHLGIWARERKEQAEALVGTEWLGNPACRGPVALCGDLNAHPRSSACRILSSQLRPVQNHLAGHHPQATFSGRFPFQRLDYVFINEAFDVLDVRIPRSHLARMASDHLPLVVTLRLHPSADSRRPPGPVPRNAD